MKVNLFRGKCISDDTWVFGYHVLVTDFETHEECSMIISSDVDLYLYSDLSQFDFVDPMSVGQYFGLPDCRGTKIFEGDILGNSENQRILVKDIRDFEVIAAYVAANWWVVGNVFDNPELIRKG